MRVLYVLVCLTFLADICKSYQNLRDGTRKYDYITVNPKCNIALDGRYRFQGAARTKMVTTCPPVNRCDTAYPVWLYDNHPTVAQGARRTAGCAHKNGNCCEIWYRVLPSFWPVPVSGQRNVNSVIFDGILTLCPPKQSVRKTNNTAIN